MIENIQKPDYLASDISELASRRRAMRSESTIDLSNAPKAAQSQMTRAVARRLLPACLAVPAVLWWVLILGVHRGWYQLETSFVLFVFSVALVFGFIVCLSLRLLSKLDAQRTQDQDQLKLAKEAAEAANRFKSAFFANISHEIRTPLTAINGFAELLLNPERTSEQRLSDARVIRRNGEHLLTLINDILDLSKIEAGKMSVDRILCSPARVVGEVCLMLQQRAEEKGLSLTVKFEGAIPKMIRTDPTRLRQILINLIANAIKFTSEGGVRLTVRIKPASAGTDPMLEVKISDTGIGISPERQAALFQPFVQGDASIARQYGGSGLGLAISRHFARALGGDIAVSSEAKQGSTFTVTVNTDSLANVEIEEKPAEAMETQENFGGPRVRIAGTVLVAEDGLDNQALISARLTATGLKVEIAPNGQVACEKALAAMQSGKPYDLILMDVQMPVLDGFSATHQLRGAGYRGPIIALTANAMERDRNKCMTAGCNDFVTKPIKMEALFKAMGKYLKIVPVTERPSLMKEASASVEVRTAQAEKFYHDLPNEIAQMQQAVERQDRVRLKEVAQLLLGKAAAAGLRDVAPQAMRLLQSAENERSWINLTQAVGEFVGECQVEGKTAAA